MSGQGEAADHRGSKILTESEEEMLADMLADMLPKTL